MVSRRYLLAFGPGGGLTSGLLVGILSVAFTGHPDTPLEWGLLLGGSVAGFSLFGWLTFYLWLSRRAQRRRAVVSRLAEGDLTALPRGESDAELQRLVLSLRRALWQVQRVTAGLHRTSREVAEQSNAILEAARRQGAAVERSQTAVESMGQSLGGAGKRVAQLDSFARETTTALSEMTHSIEQVAEALASLNATTGRNAERAEAVSRRASTVAEAGEALNALALQTREVVAAAEGTIDAVKRRTDETSELAREATSTAERGEHLVGDSLRGLRRIDDTVRRAAKLVDALGISSQEIGRVVDVIQEIADQTNLLALNAAIIASQAGESGKAFAVVAAEVRNLAEKTARSTRDIGQRVKAVREGAERAVDLVMRGRREAEAGVGLGEKAAGALKEIRHISQRALSAVESTRGETARLEQQGATLVTASAQMTERVAEVLTLSAEQAAQSRELVKQTQDMSQVSRSSSERAEGQVRVGRDLSDSVLRLTAAIDELRKSQQVLTQGDRAISEEVAEVREDAQKVVRISDSMSRTVEQLAQEAETLDAEVFRFNLPRPRAGGTLRVGLHRSISPEETRALDPLFTIDLQVCEVSSAMYSTLLRFEDGMLVPDLAESWEADPGARRFRLKLRKGVTFTDGVPFTAQHVRAHFERLLDPKVGAPDAPLFKDIAGVAEYVDGRVNQVEGIEALDEHTLEFRLAEPRAFFLRLLALPSAGITRAEGGRLIGTGPFRLKALERGAVTLERNPGYYHPGLPLVSHVEFLQYPSRRDALEAYKAGEVQLVSYLHAENLTESQLDPTDALMVNTPSVWFLGFNARLKPFDDVRVRRAIRAGLDVRALVDRFHPGARVARSLTPPSLLEVDRIHEPRTDVTLARRLLVEAGHPKVKIVMGYPPDRDTREEDRALFAPLVEAGLVELEHTGMAEGPYWEKVREGRMPVFRGNWIADVADPDNFLYVLLNSRAQRYYGLGHQNLELDRLTDDARITIDPGVREQLYRKAETLVREDCVVVPLYHERFHAAATPSVQGLRLHQTPPQVRFEEVWLDL